MNLDSLTDWAEEHDGPYVCPDVNVPDCPETPRLYVTPAELTSLLRGYCTSGIQGSVGEERRSKASDLDRPVRRGPSLHADFHRVRVRRGFRPKH